MNAFNLATQIVFWFSLALVGYTYFAYPVVLFFCYCLAQLRSDWQYLFDRQNRRVPVLEESEVPSVSLLIPAFNEEATLLQKIRNLREMDYPPEKVQIVFVSDGSTDRTNEILKAVTDPNIEAIFLPHRSGKAVALNQAVLRARHEILAFSDASTLFASDTLRKLSRHFSDGRVGAVCGALRFQASAESQQPEGVYWKYESMIRLMETRLGATLTASGAAYALRRNAYIPLAPGTVLDDFVIPMNARKAGYRVLYDPEAIATDYAPESIKGEFTRRVRLATGSFAYLMFLLHEIADERDSGPHSPKQKYAVTVTQFRDQLAEIRNGGYQVSSVREIARLADGVGQNSLAGITFDDGGSSDYEKAFPLLLEAG